MLLCSSFLNTMKAFPRVLSSRPKKMRCHYFVDFLLRPFTAHLKSAWSTPPMYMLYSFTANGQLNSCRLPSLNLLKILVEEVLWKLDTTVTAFESIYLKYEISPATLSSKSPRAIVLSRCRLVGIYFLFPFIVPQARTPSVCKRENGIDVK